MGWGKGRHHGLGRWRGRGSDFSGSSPRGGEHPVPKGTARCALPSRLARPQGRETGERQRPQHTCSSGPSLVPICCCSSCLAFTQVAMSCCRASMGTTSSGTVPLVRFRANSQT